jgi:hypothetical protein
MMIAPGSDVPNNPVRLPAGIRVLPWDAGADDGPECLQALPARAACSPALGPIRLR